MLDDLREQAGGSEFDSSDFADLEGFEAIDEEFEDYDDSSSGRRRPGLDLGMTPAQRAMLSVLLLGCVCILSALCLLITGRIAF